MGTRGSLGFRSNGTDYLSYNHFDSYPSGLGVEVLKFVRRYAGRLDNLKAKLSKLKAVTQADTPTPKDIKALAPFTELAVSEQSTADWYCLTRATQGDLVKILKSGYMYVDNEFILDSLFCEYAYIINLDSETLEVYEGFQRKRHDKGRYGRKTRSREPLAGDSKYWGCALIKEYPLADLPDKQQFIKDCERE